MKRKFHHPERSASELSGPRYWRSLDELTETPGFKAQVEREFPEGAANLEGVDRRQFFKLMAASFALGGVGLAAGCRRPEAHILAYGRSVEGVIPGLPLYFATAFPLRKAAIPLIAETHQGRPTKLEGNPTYTPHGGATSLKAQASILELYDPDRATTHTIKGAAATPAAINDLLTRIGAEAAANGGASLAFLAEESSSPTRAALVGRLKARFPSALWSEYEPVGETAPAAATQAAFGRTLEPIYRFRNAKRIVSVDADFLHTEGASLRYAREFSDARRVTKRDDPMNRLYVAESTFTLAGSMADHRLRLASSHMLAFVGALAAKITGDAAFGRLAQGLDFKDKDRWIEACASDLGQHRGESIVIAGPHLPAEVHVVVHAINAALGNIGRTIEFTEAPTPAAGIAELAARITSGAVTRLVVLGGNPAYNAPVDLDFPALLKKVEVIRYGYYVDETTRAASTHIAATHYLESWGDARAGDGTILPIQPMILPLFGGLTEIEVLARIAGGPVTDPYTLVYNTITPIAGGEPAAAFRKFLHEGLLEGSAYRPVPVTFNASGVAQLLNRNVATPATLSKDSLEVRFTFDYKIDDGRFANNGWLQELPDPITKISWDNAIQVSPRLAQDLGIDPKGSFLQIARKDLGAQQQGQEMAVLAKVTVNGRSVEGPLHIQPGLSNYTVILPLGYGRTSSGRVGNGVGKDFYSIRTSSALHVATGATITPTGVFYPLANTQEHWSMEGRDIVREANLDEVTKEGGPGLGFVSTFGMETHSPSILGKEGEAMSMEQRAALTPRGNSLYDHPNLDGVHQWGMSIDLNTCIGCNTCVIACQAENNIPIVGKDQVLRGREMHWLRLDRYYSDGRADAAAFGGEGNRELPEDPQVSLQPMLCVHCETAPCETVCPVNATVHDSEGLNTMAYNRCIGTRYCANNCPYKVRRFNFFDWNKRQLDSLYLGPLGPSGMPELAKMVKNPEVSVRMRGVMEKCTYCVQRIQNAKIAQKRAAGASNDVVVRDGAIKTACQQACPVNAIVFGNIRDENSAVSKAKARENDYAVLGYLNTRPRTTYLGKLRNPNAAMPDYVALPHSRTEYNEKNHPSHGDEHGAHGTNGHGHETEKKKSSPGHTTLTAAMNLGGLS